MTQQNTSHQDPRSKNYIGSTLLFFGIFSTATVVGLLLIAGMLTSFQNTLENRLCLVCYYRLDDQSFLRSHL